jgi:DNA-binding MarR family transcriptional regulator
VLTPSGAALAQSAVAALLAVESRMLAPLDEPQRAEIARGLETLLAALAAPRE